MTALVTAIFGSLAVAIATNSVTRALGERELQFKIVDALIQYTKEPGMKEVPAISKLDALTSLIKDNQQFSLKVDGFQLLVKEFKEDELRKARGDIAEARDDVAKAVAEKADLVRQSSARSNDDRRELQGKISDKEREIMEARVREREANESLIRAREDLLKIDTKSGNELKNKERELAAVQEQLRQERMDDERQRQEIERLRKEVRDQAQEREKAEKALAESQPAPSGTTANQDVQCRDFAVIQRTTSRIPGTDFSLTVGDMSRQRVKFLSVARGRQKIRESTDVAAGQTIVVSQGGSSISFTFLKVEVKDVILGGTTDAGLVKICTDRWQTTG